MKKLFILTVFFFVAQVSFSQVYVNEVNINEKAGTFIQLVGVNTSVFGTKYQIYVDYGQKVKAFKGYKIKDAAGNVKKFNTMMDALNFMYDNGWDYVNYNSQMVSGKIRNVYLLKRRK